MLRSETKISSSPSTYLSRYHWTTRPFEHIYQLINLEKGKSIKQFTWISLSSSSMLVFHFSRFIRLMAHFSFRGKHSAAWNRNKEKNSLSDPESPNPDQGQVFFYDKRTVFVSKIAIYVLLNPFRDNEKNYVGILYLINRDGNFFRQIQKPLFPSE